MDTTFEFISDRNTRQSIQNGYRTITNLELWDWLRQYQVDENRGFMFSNNSNLDRIGKYMESQPDSVGHSGGSFGFTMRHLQFIAKNGLDEYKKAYYTNARPSYLSQ
jgi:hypothetical protein